MKNGILIIDKPEGWTSHDVVGKLRHVLQERRIGHGGTLDPMATGVLPVFVGRATRAVEFFESAEKEYIASIRLGIETTTEDITGEVLATHPVNVTPEDMARVLRGFIGVQTQIPPMYAAIKVGGKKLYELAREGKTVERHPRGIEILETELLGGEGSEFRFRVRCSKGTYIRTLCADIGKALGCGGCMSALRRSRAGSFSLSQAITMENVLRAAEHGTAAELLRPVDLLFPELPAVTLSPRQEKACRNGAAFPLPGVRDGDYRVYAGSGEFLMLGRCSRGICSTIKSFFEVSSS